ncbi:AfsR/SARP family transcriptional regulator [Kribbella albertanoniae]|uniref:AfsR/SARP family transcriptional regulator n=1 Tax=Kribbella albertanoniae TaxID=1266829 RepID=UPI001404B34F|nr:BTAD domain-containing putative transcriptional regulator [Kribbella albertanoniae]
MTFRCLGAALEIRLLGPVEVWAGDARLEIGSAKPRLVLAVLAASPGTLVPVEVLMDRVWGEGLPGRPAASLYPYLSKLRRVLEPAGIELVRRSGGYLCAVGAGDVDVARFRERVRAAKESDQSAAIELLDEALALWRGQPLADLSGDWVNSFRVTLSQERLAGWLGLARHRERAGSLDLIAEELLALTEDYPLSEPLAGYVLSALALAGRRAEALDHYAGLRERLADELGVEPGHELSGLHTALLRNTSAAPLPHREAGAAVPRQLPAVARPFVGRAEHLKRLDELADAVGSGDEGTAVVAAITGPGGIGKTTLAVHWAHQAAGRFPDGQLYLNLRGFDPLGTPMPPSEAVRGVLEALGQPTQEIPAGLEARAALFRSLIAGRRVLVLLDNARDAEQVRPMLPGAGGCLVVVTSRNALAGLVAERGAEPIRLDPFATADAWALLQARLTEERLTAEPAAVADLLRPCGGLPLALAVVAGRAAQHPTRPLAELAGELASPRRLDAFDTDDPRTTIRAVFDSSYDALEPEAQRAFRLLGLHPGPDISASAAASLTGNASVHTALRQLEAAHLVTVQGGRYGMHDLVRVYAAELAESDPERGVAARRMLDHYLWGSYTSEQFLVPHRLPPALVPPPVRPGVAPDEPADPDTAIAWFGAERLVLLRLVHAAWATDLDAVVIQFSDTFGTFLWQQRLFDDWITVEKLALAAAERLGDRAAATMAHKGLGRAYIGLGRYPEAAGQLDAALEIACSSGDQMGVAGCHQMLAALHERQRDYASARHHAQQAHELHTRLGDEANCASSLNQIGWFSALLGEYAAAVSACKAAIEIGRGRTLAAAWDSLGYAYHHSGDHGAAIDAYRHAVAGWRETGDQHFVADTLTHLGDALEDAGEHAEARRTWRHALDTLAGFAGPAAAEARSALAERLAVDPSR